jgi:hypothetical protein
VPQISSRQRVARRLLAAAGRAVAVGGRTVAQAASDCGLSWPVVHAAFLDRATAVLSEEPEPVVALGIDEARRGRPRFALNSETGVFEQVTDRWHTGFVDLTGEQGLLGQVEGRSSSDAGSWLAARTQHWRVGVATVAIDTCSAYRATVRKHLPHATLVVDHFHVVQLANQVLSSVRRRVTAKPRGRRVRKDDPEYGLRRRLMRNREDLTGEKFTDMWNRLIDLGQAGDEILAAWIAKEELRTLLSLARTGASRHQISHPYGLSTNGAPTPTPPNCTASPGPSRHGGRRSRRSHRHHQRRQRRHQPADQTRGPQRLRLPQPHQPTPTITLREHPSILATNQARPTSKTPLSAVRKITRIAGLFLTRTALVKLLRLIIRTFPANVGCFSNGAYGRKVVLDTLARLPGRLRITCKCKRFTVAYTKIVTSSEFGVREQGRAFRRQRPDSTGGGVTGVAEH